jgi:hypothetical protein
MGPHGQGTINDPSGSQQEVNKKSKKITAAQHRVSPGHQTCILGSSSWYDFPSMSSKDRFLPRLTSMTTPDQGIMNCFS